MHTEPNIKDQPPWSFVEAQRVWIVQNSFVTLPPAGIALLNAQVEAQRSADLTALRRPAGPSSPSPTTEDVVSPDAQAIDCDLARVQLQIDALLIELNACRAQMVGFQSERLEITSQTKNKASKSPVESLPFEILAKIFELLPSLYDPACLKHHPSITDICAVSSVWRQALLHYPKVCNAIAPGIRSTFTYTPSGGLSYAHTSAGGSSPSPFLQAIAPFYAHIEELKLDENSERYDVFAVFLGLPAGSLPLLTRIDLEGSLGLMPSQDRPVFEDGAPALCRVSLRIRYVWWDDSLRWGSITHLKVETTYLADGALHRMLLASPNLEVASFVLAETIEDPIFDGLITCARMKSFCVRLPVRYDPHFERIMSTICLPGLETVDLSLHRDAKNPSPFSSLATSLFSSDTLRRVCLSGLSQNIVGHLRCLTRYRTLEELVLVLSDEGRFADYPREVLAALRGVSARGSNVKVLACLKSFSVIASRMRVTHVAALATDIGELVVGWMQDPERAGVLESVSFRVDEPQGSSGASEVALDWFRDRLRPWMRDAEGGLVVKAALEKVGTEYTDWFNV
ncbi:hypothetical protein DXG01_016820 [Tephrocybe rancida]|nr:hypothetical protein DXG01_016820 [Tephrocybe rancida]